MRFLLVRVLMALACVHAAVLGVAFLFFTPQAYEAVAAPMPEDLGPVRFSAALVLVFAWMFACVVADPVRYAPFISAGMGLKAAFVGVVIYRSQTAVIEPAWLWLAAADGAWLMLFVVIRAALPRWWNRPDLAVRARPDRPG